AFMSSLKKDKKDWFESSINDGSLKVFEYDSFENKKIIPTSGASPVYSADLKYEVTTKAVALKTYNSNVSNDVENPFDGFIREVRTNYKIGYHKNIIQFLGITRDLQCYLNNNFHNLDWLAKVKMAKDIASGIEHLHRKDIVHRDLHDKNILVNSDGRLMITDFGLSKQLGDDTSPISAG
ncbi:30059_t:CDS:2, partial [Racocetra persica]